MKIFAFLFLATSSAAALSFDDPASRADTIMTGTVLESRSILHRTPRSTFYYVRLKTKVEGIEKGREQTRGAEIIEVRCWHNVQPDVGGPVGHNAIPADGSRFRAWLTRHEEGYFEAIAPNGFELLDGSAARVFPPVPRRTLGMWQIVGGLIVLLVVCGAAFRRYRGQGTRDRSWSEPVTKKEDPS